MNITGIAAFISSKKTCVPAPSLSLHPPPPPTPPKKKKKKNLEYSMHGITMKSNNALF